MRKIWKPRSRRKPSKVSVRTRPPTESEESRRRNGVDLAWRCRAAERPDRPAPIIRAVGGDGEGWVLEVEAWMGCSLEVKVSWRIRFIFLFCWFGLYFSACMLIYPSPV